VSKSSPAYLTAEEAAAELGVSRPTLYAYVSRGLLRSEAGDEGKRARRYSAAAVRHLKESRQQRADPERLAQNALHWGLPVLESAITLIGDGQFYYRGQSAVELALTEQVENVAALIWLGRPEAALFSAEPPSGPADWPVLASLPHFERLQVALPLAASKDLAAYDFRPAGVAQTGARIMRLMVAAVTGSHSTSAGLATTLQAYWAPGESRARRLLNAALVLCADHELNVSSFTARCVASAGATPYAVVAAGLAALQGARHGGLTGRVEALFDEVAAGDSARMTMAARLRRGEALPGFGHPLYPAGDPRGRLLLQLAAEHGPSSPVVALADAMAEAALALLDERPTLDFGLVTLARLLRLPPGGPLTLFALGRTIGWLGQAIEQYESGQMIRPRARYVGPPPTD
jgi:citrate synthase